MLLLNVSIHSATYMKKCTNSCEMESSSNMQIVDLMLHQDKQPEAYYQKRYSNSLLDDEVLNRHKMQDPFNFCQMANEQGVKTKMWSRSSNTNNHSRHSKSLQHSSHQKYRRTQSNSIFELCSCLSASSNSSTSSTS